MKKSYRIDIFPSFVIFSQIRKIEFLNISILLFGILFLRGTLIAEMSYGAAFAVLFFSFYLILSRKIKIEIEVFQFVLILLFALLLSGIISVLYDSKNAVVISKMIFTYFLPVLLMPIILSNTKQVNHVARGFIFINLLFIWSYVVTILLIVFGVKWNLATINYDYPFPAHVYFPFTIFYGSPFKGDLILFPRLLSFYRESGITQIMFFFCFIQIDNLFDRNKSFMKLSFLVGVLMTLSTVGLVSFLFMVLHIFLRKRNWTLRKVETLSLLIAVISIFILVYYLPIIGLREKMIGESSQSFIYRFSGLQRAFESIQEYPIFGLGLLNNPYGNDGEPSNFLISVYQLGLPLWVITFSLFIYYVYRSKKLPLRKLTEASPIFITMFFAQPLLLSPVFIFYFLINFQNHSESCVKSQL